MTTEEIIKYGGIVLVVAICLIAIFYKRLRSWYGEYSLNRTVQKLGTENLRNIVLQDEVEGSVFIDNIILSPEGIFIMLPGHYKGAVFAAENIDLWTQVVGQRTYKFPNPLHQVEHMKAAVRTCIPKQQVNDLIIYGSDVEFPKGKPDNLISMIEARQRFAFDMDVSITPELQAAWDTLKQHIIVENPN